jgi:hypothetical protein
MVGASFVGTALGFFAQHIVDARSNWYETEVLRKAYEASVIEYKYNYFIRGKLFIEYEFDKLKGIFLWVIFLFVGTACAWSLNNWTFVNALYFSISSMSTGGLYSLPADSPNWYYGMTGFYASLGGKDTYSIINYCKHFHCSSYYGNGDGYFGVLFY